MSGNDPKAFKNFYIVIKCPKILNDYGINRAIRHIDDKIIEIPSKSGKKIDIGSLFFLSKDDLIIVYCIINDNNLSKRQDTINEIIILHDGFEIKEIKATTLPDLIYHFKESIQNNFKIVSVPK